MSKLVGCKKNLGLINDTYQVNPQTRGLLESLFQSMPRKDRAILSYESQPASIKDKIESIKKLQLETIDLEIQFTKEMLEIEQKYTTKHQSIYSKRAAIIAGFKSDSGEKDRGDSVGAIKQCANKGDVGQNPSEFVKDCHLLIEAELEERWHDLMVLIVDEEGITHRDGIPHFWLTVLHNARTTGMYIHEPDIEALKHLVDIRSDDINENGRYGIELQFHFEPNEFFTNSCLTKRYYFEYDKDDENPHLYDGLEVDSCQGCTIDWQPGKQATRSNPDDKDPYWYSFFDYFGQSLTRNKNFKSYYRDTKLTRDYEIGQFIRERLIPRAALFFTGEAIDLDQPDIEIIDESSSEDAS